MVSSEPSKGIHIGVLNKRRRPIVRISDELEPEFELVRLERKGNSIFAYFSKRLTSRMDLSRERYLVGYTDGRVLVLFRDSSLAEFLKPTILEARKVFSELRAKARDAAARTGGCD